MPGCAGLFFGYNAAMPALTSDHILYHDDELLVLNKPAGVPVHGSRMLEGQPETLLGMARQLTGRMVHAVHRLDRPVSGAILMAFNRRILADMSIRFEQREVKKNYLAVARGWMSDQGVIDYPLLPPRDERKDDSVARDAVTRFTCLARVEIPIAVPPYPTTRYSLLELEPETGRRHQLRRHLKHVSHPLAGDTTYGRGEHNRLFRQHYDCRRLLLHSRFLGFEHPVNGGYIRTEAPLDKTFSAVIDALGWARECPLPAGSETPE